MSIKRRGTKLNKIAKQVKKGINGAKKKRKVAVEFFTTGCTTINLAISNHRNKGLPRCRITNFVGDGSSGKTLIALESAFNFKKHIPKIKSKVFGNNKKPIVHYNNGEGVMDFPLDKMYGEEFSKSITWKRSKTIEAVGRDYLESAKNLKPNEALLYIIDSWDSFKSIHDTKIREEKDEDIIKGYNLKKQQFAWTFFAQACDLLENNNCDATLIVISQTKQKIGVTFGKKQYRTGGDALNFYTHLVCWIRTIKRLAKTKNKESRVYGIESELQVERSKVGLCFRTAPFMHLYDYGIDNVGSLGLYLKKRSKSAWRAIKLTNLHEFAKNIEKRNIEKELAKSVEKIWVDIENRFQDELLERKEKRL